MSEKRVGAAGALPSRRTTGPPQWMSEKEWVRQEPYPPGGGTSPLRWRAKLLLSRNCVRPLKGFDNIHQRIMLLCIKMAARKSVDFACWRKSD